MSAPPDENEFQLIAGVRRGVARDINQFRELAATAVWTPVIALVGRKHAKDAFDRVIAALAADGYARLARFDARQQLSHFLALQTREILGAELARDCASEPHAAWPRFEQFFRLDLLRCIRKRFPRADPAALEDELQNLRERLIEDDYRRLRAFDGSGGFHGFVLCVVDRLLIDRMRQDSGGRRRLPAQIQRLGPLEQAVFIARTWDGIPPNPQLIMATTAFKIRPQPTIEQVAAVLRHLGPAIAEARARGHRPTGEPIGPEGEDETTQVTDPSGPIDKKLIEEEEQARLDALIERVRQSVASVPDPLRRYLRLRLETGDPPRKLAALMGVETTDIYKLKDQGDRWLKQIVAEL